MSLVLLSPELGALRLWSFYFPPCWMDVVEVCFHQGMKCLIPDSVTCRWSFTPPEAESQFQPRCPGSPVLCLVWNFPGAQVLLIHHLRSEWEIQLNL